MSKTVFRRLLGLTLLLLTASLSVSCATKEEIVYARATKYPEEVNGFMRVATEEPIMVNVAGTDHTGERVVAGYILIHEQDLAALVQAVKKGE